MSNNEDGICGCEVSPTKPAEKQPGYRTDLVKVGSAKEPRFLQVVRAECDVPLAAVMWFSSRVLTKFLASHLDGPLSKLRVLELGAGCGVPGMALAQQGATVMLTDLAGACPPLELNVRANFATATATPRVMPLHWDSSSETEEALRQMAPLDYVIGADVRL